MKSVITGTLIYLSFIAYVAAVSWWAQKATDVVQFVSKIFN